MQTAIEEVLRKRRDRAIAIILGTKERECDAHLPAMASTKLRKVVLDQLNDFYDMCRDVMDSLDTGEVTLNDEYLAKLDEVHAAVMDSRAGVSNGAGP